MDEALINAIYSFSLLAVRFGTLFIVVPIFSSKAIPMQLKSGMTLLCCIILYPVIFNENLIAFPDNIVQIIYHVGNEFLAGFILGFAVLLTFAIFQLAGQFIDIRMGFALANIVDPLTGLNAPLVGQFKNILAMLILLSVNGHHQIIKALIKSYQVLPVTTPVMNQEILEYIFRMGGDIFLIAFRLAFPIIATLFIIDIIFGFLARTVPQMNVFMLGFPTKIGVGYMMLFLSIPILVKVIGEVLHMMEENLLDILKIIQ